jgi:molecular chaperone Hsp33
LDAALHPHEVLFRLFHEGGVRAHDTVHVMHRCRCGLERAERALTALSEAEAEELADHGRIEVRCEFCNSTYTFTLQELSDLRAEQENDA